MKKNKLLLIIFLGVVLTFLIVKFVKTPKKTSNFQTEIIDFEKSQISQILLYPSTEGKNEIKFTKSDEKWIVSNSEFSDDAEQEKVNNLINEILKIKPERLAGTSEKKHKDFELTDSAATEIIVKNESGEILLDLLSGKLSFKQIRNSYNQMGGNQNIKGISYVRLKNDKKIYAVDGMLKMTFDYKFNNWRDKSFLKLNDKNFEKITLEKSGKSIYVLKKENQKWLINNEPADSVSVKKYLGNLSNSGNFEFANNYNPKNNSDYKIFIEQKNIPLLQIKIYKENLNYFLNFSTKPKTYFNTDSSTIYRQFLKKLSDFKSSQKNN